MLPADSVVAGVYRVRRLLGEGGFGRVYAGTDTRTGGAVAIKTEALDAPVPQLLIEHKVLHGDLAGVFGFPRAYWFSVEHGVHVLVMERLGADLEHLRGAAPGGVLPCATVMDVARQVLQRLAALHSRGIIHRDVKPDNLLYGLGPASGTVFLIDFGLAKRVAAPGHDHIPADTQRKRLIGTPRFTSINCHLGHQQSRRDDLEALVYVLVYLVKGSLPWQGLPAPGPDDTNYSAICAAKQAAEPPVLCVGLPPVFAYTLAYARGLAFDALPDYPHLLAMWDH